MMQVMKDIGGIEFPESLIRFADNSQGAREGAPKADTPTDSAADTSND